MAVDTTTEHLFSCGTLQLAQVRQATFGPAGAWVYADARQAPPGGPAAVTRR